MTTFDGCDVTQFRSALSIERAPDGILFRAEHRRDADAVEAVLSPADARNVARVLRDVFAIGNFESCARGTRAPAKEYGQPWVFVEHWDASGSPPNCCGVAGVDHDTIYVANDVEERRLFGLRTEKHHREMSATFRKPDALRIADAIETMLVVQQ